MSKTVAETVALDVCGYRGAFARVKVVSLASFLGVSRQRASKLLRDGCIEGASPDNDGTWWISTPVRLKPGSRGPVSGYAKAGYSPRRPNRMLSCVK